MEQRLRVGFSRTGGQTYSFHLLPSGLMSPKTDNLIGSGVVFNVEAFFKELSQLEFKGVPRVHAIELNLVSRGIQLT